MENFAKIKSIDALTWDVLKIVTEKPPLHNFIPGQATEVALNKNTWRNEKRPFTFTCLPQDDYLEFTIKTYPGQKGVTNELLTLQPGNELILGDVFGSIQYKGEGIFIAGGAGVTPFISIFRQLKANNEIGNNQLIFANKTKADIINKAEFESLLGDNFINILSGEKTDEYIYGHINKDFLKATIENFDQKFYVCGPPQMVKDILHQLKILGVSDENVVKEED